MMTNLTPEDIRRLQVLNDYIAQSIDAVQRLNPILQQRGLWHSAYSPVSPWGAVGGQTLGATPWQTGYNPFATTSPTGIPLQAMGAGLSHTGLPYGTGVGALDAITGMIPGVTPFAGSPFGRAPFGVGAFPQVYGGLSHSPFVDPVLASVAGIHGTGIGSTFGAGIGSTFGSAFGVNPLVEAYRADAYRRAIFGF